MQMNLKAIPMTDTVTLTIDGIETTVPTGTTILDAAVGIGITIPVICYHPHLTANGLCRICSVDTGGRLLAAACVTPCQPGMTVTTQNPSIQTTRRTILELLSSAVNLEESPEIIHLVQAYQADPGRFAGGERRNPPVYDDNPFYLRDYSQCINCWRCVQVCADDAQFAYALNFNGRGFHTQIGTFMMNGMMDTTCVFCGQCLGVCPTGALKPKRQALLEAGIDPDEISFQSRPPKRKTAKGDQA